MYSRELQYALCRLESILFHVAATRLEFYIYGYTVDIQYIHILPERIPVGWVLLSKLVLHRVVGRVSFATSLKTFPNIRVGQSHNRS